VVLAGAALFVYLRLRADLDESVNSGLSARATAFAATRAAGVGDPEEGLAQLLGPSGHVLAAEGRVRAPVLRGPELRRARRGRLVLEQPVAGIEGDVRLLARPGPGDDDVVVVGQSLDDRDETLASLVGAFVVGTPVAVLLASLLGYALASAGLAPMEAMRRRATEVSLRGGRDRLPVPEAHDEVRRLGETLNDMLGRLRDSFERERRFVADASHELRTPIATVKLELEGALRSGDCGPRTRQALVAAIEECDRIAQLAEDLLVLARAADGRLPVRPEELLARALLEDVRHRFVDRAARHSRRIDVRAPGDLALVADPLRMRQALANLVDNALRHGGGDVLLAARANSAGAEVEVRDEGTGFGAGSDAWAFEPFSSGDQARVEGGAGLGLAMVRAIAEAHGGSAEIVPGPGARVVVRLPALSQRDLSAAS
jgi:two-component system, OmpR family, sensor kinase